MSDPHWDTGKWRLRHGWRGKLILQVLEKHRAFDIALRSVEETHRWRDAKITDFPLPLYMQVTK